MAKGLKTRADGIQDEELVEAGVLPEPDTSLPTSCGPSGKSLRGAGGQQRASVLGDHEVCPEVTPSAKE